MPRSRRLSDATLVRRSQQGDRRSFTALLTRYDWRLRGLAHALLLDPAEMDAALGVGYLRAWRDVVRISPSDNVAAWLYRVVYNACIDQLRRADDPAPRAATAAPPAGGVATGLAALPAAERVAVVLVDREGFSPSSAARIMGLSPDAVTATLDRARATLGEHVPTAPPAVVEPEGPAVDPAPERAADPEPVGHDAGDAGSPAGSGAAPVDDSPAGRGAAVSGTQVDGSPAGTDPAAIVDPAAGDGELATGEVATGEIDAGEVATGEIATGEADAGDPEDTDGFEDHGPIDHEAVADAVVVEGPADDSDAGDTDAGDPTRARENDGAVRIAPRSDGAPGTAESSDGAPSRARESDGVRGNGNGNAPGGQNGHVSNSGRGRRSRRRAKHAAAQRRADGTGPAGDDTA